MPKIVNDVVKDPELISLQGSLNLVPIKRPFLDKHQPTVKMRALKHETRPLRCLASRVNNHFVPEER